MKKFLAPIAITACVLCLAGCSMGSEPTHKTTDPLPDKVVESEVEEETTEVEEEKTTEATTEKHVKTDEELEQEYEEWKAEVLKERDEATQEQTTENTEATEATTEETADPYSGLAVSNCHSVTVTKGTSYNDCMDKIIEGCTAYPNTFPVIDNVDLNTPGVYSCAWVRLMDDGTYLPLNYATFTVTVIE